jgi:hypothetical protein
MIGRRRFLAMMAGAAAAPRFAMAQSGGGKLVVYASVGPELRWYDANVADATLEQRGSVRVPANIQYVWPHISRRYLYATSSDPLLQGLGGFVGKTHHASALRVDPASGALALRRAGAARDAAIHNSTGPPPQYLLTAYNIGRRERAPDQRRRHGSAR